MFKPGFSLWAMNIHQCRFSQAWKSKCVCVCDLLVLFSPRWHHLVIVLLSVLWRCVLAVVRLVHVAVRPVTAGQPRVHQQFRRCESLSWRLPQHAANQTLGLWRQPAGQAERPAADLGEQRGGLRVLKRVPSDQHGVKRHAQAPDVRGATRVGPGPVGQQLGADVGGTAVSVCQRVIVMVTVQNDAVIEAEQGETGPERGRTASVFTSFQMLCSSALQRTSASSHLYLSVKTNRRSFTSLRTTPWRWQCAIALSIWANRCPASSSSRRFLLRTYACMSPW